ncbi:hypothetical protein EDC39_10121 [Geothermobacter ehrlichii]|uniref:Uncharacterized protein n=1 Tax=Geothermobacter ehrlichii TaxID=213224 RepID=A0A5D3WMT7_9BACT|nr:hypothetical protein [Geothermobacter ehrlichii]TYO99861.1 hypothetical protein EDC39_10121 [Geothermobacter ehrlichii]
MDWHIAQLVLWLIAGIVSFYFSIGNARVWTSIAVGFGLIVIGELLPQAVPYLPGVGVPRIEAMSYIVGTISILVMSHGFQEYYVFSRTLEFEGNKAVVYLATLGVVIASVIFVFINPLPDERTLEIIRVVENSNWVFLSLINIDLIRKIYANIKDSPISKGFIAFIVVFFFIFLWRGSELYIQVYHFTDPAVGELYPFRFQLSQICSDVGNFLAGISVGGTFFYLARLLR